MSDMLLQTKLHRPPLRSSTIQRSRLIGALNEGLGWSNAGFAGKVSLVSAPPGFGKTTLTLSWLKQLPVNYRIAWLSLETFDDDPQRFFAYLLGALQAVQADIGGGLETTSQFPPPDAAVEILVNVLSSLSLPLILVLDDYHVINNPAINQAMAYFFDHVPAHMHLVVIARSDPPFSLSRLRIRRQLTEIRTYDLRFTLEEATAFLNEIMGQDLSPAEISLLESRTEGWAAGLQLAAHSLPHGEAKTQFLDTFSGDDRFVADYLMEEVLSCQPESIQSFLLQTSILDQLHGPLCDAMMDTDGSQATLEYLEQANLFVIPVDNRRQWYRYHQMFRDFLRERVSAQSEHVKNLHRTASQWYAEHGYLVSAIEHMLLAGYFDVASKLILDNVAELFGSSQLSLLLKWWQKLPEAVVKQKPELGLMAAWAWLATGQEQESEACLQQVEKILGARAEVLLEDIGKLDPQIRNGLIETTSIRLSNPRYSSKDYETTLALCEHILPYLTPEQHEHLFSPLIVLRPVILFNMGIARKAFGQLDQAQSDFEETITLGKTFGNAHLVSSAIGHLADIQHIRGRLLQAFETCQRGISLVESLAGKISPLSGILHVQLAYIAYEWNDLEMALEQFALGIDVAKPWNNRIALLLGYLGLMQTYQAIGRDKHALEAGKAFETEIMREPMPTDSAPRAIYARLCMERGDPATARKWYETFDWPSDRLIQHETEVIASIHLKYYLGETDDALQVLEDVLTTAQAGSRWGRVVELLVLKALLLDENGSEEQALNALTQALELGEEQSYSRTLIDHGTRIAPLLSRSAQSGITPNYVKRLQAAMADIHPAAPQSDISKSLQKPSWDDPLSEREFEILTLIAEGLTNREIAAHLHLAYGTVKVHAHNIYSKLGAKNRAEAVAIARRLELLP